MARKGERAIISSHDSKTGVTWKWFGGHSIRGYRNGKEIAILNVGDFSKDSLTYDEAKKEIEKIKRRGWRGLADYANTEGDYEYFMRKARKSRR